MNPLTHREEESSNLKCHSMVTGNSNPGQQETNIKTGAESEKIDQNECSLSVDCVGYCVSLNPVDDQDMTRCISEDLFALDSTEPSLSLQNKVEPVSCFGLEICSSDQDEIKSSMDIDLNMQIEYSPSLMIQDRHEIDSLNSTSGLSSAADGYMPQICSLGSSNLPVNTLEACKESHFTLDQGIERKLSREAQTEIDDDGLSLDQLDDDVLFHIASFLEARVLRFALIHVCQRFRVMFASETYWKMRTTLRWPKQFPAVTCPPDFNWVDACVEREDSHRVWTNEADNRQHFKYLYNLFGGVDAVHLMKEGQMVVCGDRSRTLNLIDLSKYPGAGSNETQMKDMLCHCDRVVHQGWIWSISSAGNQIVTGSWDTYVRMFDAEAGCKLTSSFKCHSSVLSLYAENNETVASCSDKKVYFFDHRTSDIRFETFHTQPVLCVTGNENFIISGSEDKSISVYDRRAGKILNVFKLKNYPLCMSYTDNQLWFGDRNGTLHLHDGTDGMFHDVGSYDIGHTEKMTGVVSTRGALYTCSGDRTIKVLHPTRDPDKITTLAVHEKEIAKIDYNSGVLVSAGGDCIGVWLPKHWGKDTYLL